jgi:hypothetical protein
MPGNARENRVFTPLGMMALEDTSARHRVLCNFCDILPTNVRQRLSA